MNKFIHLTKKWILETKSSDLKFTRIKILKNNFMRLKFKFTNFIRIKNCNLK